MALTANPLRRAMRYFDPNFCLCNTPIIMGAHTICWLFIACDSVILLIVLGSRRTFFDEWVSILINIADDLFTLLTSIILLIGIHRRNARMHLPFIIVNAILFSFKALLVFLNVIVSLVSALKHHVNGIHIPNYYNMFIHFNMYDVFYNQSNGVLYMLFFLTLKVLVIGFYGYFITIIWRSYALLLKEQSEYSNFSNPMDLSSSFSQEEGAEDNETLLKENP